MYIFCCGTPHKLVNENGFLLTGPPIVVDMLTNPTYVPVVTSMQGDDKKKFTKQDKEK